MSSQIKPVLVRDNILMCHDEVAYAVNKGGQNVSIQRFTATSTSASSHTYTIQVPSHSTVISRELLWHSRVSITFTGVPAAGKYLVNIGQNGSGFAVVPQNPNNTAITLRGSNTDCIAPFGLHQAVENMNIQINNTSVSMNTNQILDPLLRCMDRKDLARWNSTTPVYLDNWGSYGNFTTTSELKLNSPFNGYDCVFDTEYPPRGSFSLESISGNTVGDGTAVRNVTCTFDLAEPIMLSPFVFGDVNHTSSGFYGISNMSFTFQMDPLVKRMWRFINDTSVYPTAPSAGGKVVSNVVYDNANCYIECRFLTPPPSVLLPELNVVPSSVFTNFVKVGGALASGSTTTLQSDNFQLSSIPDKVIVYVKEAKSNLRNSTPDAYCAIQNANITFSNQTGILSNATPQELWRMSVEAGSNQSWLEFSGKVASQTALGNSVGSTSSTGSVLVLDFCNHINVSEDYFSSGSIGSFNFNIQLNVFNRLDNIANLELNVVFLSSGVFSTQNGVSSLYTGVLSKEMVLSASTEQEPLAQHDIKRYVGGGFLDMLKSGLSSVLPVLKLARPLLTAIPHPAAKAVDAGLRSVGLGMTGGMQTGGMQTGGARRRLDKYMM